MTSNNKLRLSGFPQGFLLLCIIAFSEQRSSIQNNFGGRNSRALPPGKWYLQDILTRLFNAASPQVTIPPQFTTTTTTPSITPTLGSTTENLDAVTSENPVVTFPTMDPIATFPTLGPIVTFPTLGPVITFPTITKDPIVTFPTITKDPIVTFPTITKDPIVTFPTISTDPVVTFRPLDPVNTSPPLEQIVTFRPIKLNFRKPKRNGE